jgi:hypothetical protein
MQEPEPSAERLGVGPLDLSAQDSTTGGGGGPDAQTTYQARPRRPFQARRKERSCDSCKVRKTKVRVRFLRGSRILYFDVTSESADQF